MPDLNIIQPKTNSLVVTNQDFKVSGAAFDRGLPEPIMIDEVLVSVDNGPAISAQLTPGHQTSQTVFNFEAQARVPTPGPHTVAVTAINDQGRSVTKSVTVLAEIARNLAIAGIERTQAIQFFNFNGQSSGFAADNSVPGVADKTMILRVYVDLTTLPSFPISGQVTYAGHPDLFPINGPIPAMASSAIQRGNANHTLNFRVPAGHCTGSVTFTVTVFDPARPNDPASSSRSQTFTVAFDPVPLVRIRGFLINFTDSVTMQNFPAPTSDALVNTLVFAGRVFPSAGLTSRLSSS